MALVKVDHLAVVTEIKIEVSSVRPARLCRKKLPYCRWSVADPWKRLMFATLLAEEAEHVHTQSAGLDVDEHCDRIVDAVRGAAVAAFPKMTTASRARWFSQLAWQIREARVGSIKEIRQAHAILRMVELKALFLCLLRFAGSFCVDRRTRTLRTFVPLAAFGSLDKEASMLRIRRAYAEAHPRHTASSYKRIRREDKNAYLASMQKQAIYAVEKGHTKNIFKIFKELMPKKPKCNLGPLGEDGQPVVGAADRRRRRQQFFAKLLLGEVVARDELFCEQSRYRMFVIDEDLVPTLSEVEAAIMRQAIGKSSGEDNLVAEVLKADVGTMAKLLRPLVQKVLRLGIQPSRWRGGVLHELWKGIGPMRVCASFRGIFLNDVLGKIYHSLLRQRLQTLFENFAPSSQCGSVSGRGAAVAILNVRSLLQLLSAKKIPTSCFFLDIRAAFDSVCRQYVARFKQHGPESAAEAVGLAKEECDLLTRAPWSLTRCTRFDLAPLVLKEIWRRRIVAPFQAVHSMTYSLPFLMQESSVRSLKLFSAGLVLSVSRCIGTDPLGLVSSHETDEALDAT